MANFKIIKTTGNNPDVLLYRDRVEDYKESVIILAIGTMEETPNMFASEQIDFENTESAIAFIRDYTLESANEWCKKQQIKF